MSSRVGSAGAMMEIQTVQTGMLGNWISKIEKQKQDRDVRDREQSFE